MNSLKNYFGTPKKCTYFQAHQISQNSAINKTTIVVFFFLFIRVVRFKLSVILFCLVILVFGWGGARHFIYILDVTNHDWNEIEGLDLGSKNGYCLHDSIWLFIFLNILSPMAKNRLQPLKYEWFYFLWLEY
jgi:hypothetical protein